MSISKDPLVDFVTQERALIGKEVEVLSLIGRGGCGEVHEARSRPTAVHQFGGTHTFAVKTLKSAHKSCLHELCLQSFLPRHHAHLLTPLATWIDTLDGCPRIAMRRADTDLASVLKAARDGRRPPPTETEVRLWLVQCLTGLEFLHSHGVAHRDVKPHNILFFFKRGNKTLLKLADFGVAALTSGNDDGCATISGYVGTPYYMAPEIQRAAEAPSYTVAVDVWALGVCLYEMLTLSQPPRRCFSLPVEEKELQLRSDIARAHAAGGTGDCFCDDLVGLCMEMLSVNFAARPSACQLLCRLKNKNMK
eukprot:PhM_4_TR6972/c0_g1_i1/m.16831